jgi:radical SAM superfamily enzyme YgiQ (UPF0313 family)
MNKKPKILLLLPPSFLFPLGSAYVAATLENAEYDYDIYGFFYDYRAWFKKNRVGGESGKRAETIRNISARMSYDALMELVGRENYDYLLVGGLVGFFRWFYQILPRIKGYNPQCKIIMGGGITKDLPENTLFEKLNIDYVLKGEVETNLTELLNLLSSNTANLNSLLKIPGLCWKDSSSSIRKNATIRADLKEHALRPAWNSFNINEYISLSDTLLRINKTFFPILMGRGCPNVCAFCSPSVGRFIPYPVDAVISEMKYWAGKYNFDFFFIYSEVAFDDENYTKAFCRRYIDEIGKPWVGQLRTDVTFSGETYRMMKESGCMFLSMGFESFNDRILNIMRKHTPLSDHMRNLNLAREAGLSVFGNIMFGHETETAEEIRETFSYVNQYDLMSGPANGLASIIIYPGTAYYRAAERNGLLADPFKFLLSYSLKAGISHVNLRERDDSTTLNISALSNNEYYDVVCAENIKHRRLYSKRHAATDVEKAFDFADKPSFVFHGKCPTCGNQLEFTSEAYLNPLNITKVCDKCYYTVAIDIYRFPEMKRYLKIIEQSIKKSKKIIVYGSWIMDLFFCDALSMPYNKVIAWVDPDNPDVSDFQYVYHLPQLTPADLKIQEYDTIITLKSRVLSTPRIIEEQGLNPKATIIHVNPDILNDAIVKALAGKAVAIAGESTPTRKVEEHLRSDKTVHEIEHFTDILEINKITRRFDYIIFDKDEFGLDRHVFSQQSRYLLSEILYPEFLLDGGYLSCCS